MWGQALKDEGKVQGALNLWRKSARDFSRNDGDNDGDGASANSAASTPQLQQMSEIPNAPIDSATNTTNELGSENANLSDGEFPPDSDFSPTPHRHRKRRGSVTRRR